MTGNVAAAAGRIAAIRRRMDVVGPPSWDSRSVLASAAADGAPAAPVA